MYMRIYISNFENGNKTRRQKRKQNKTKIIIIINKRTTEEKIFSVENLTGYFLSFSCLYLRICSCKFVTVDTRGYNA